jgi:ATP-dependent helicase/nuclease subunit A
VLTAASYSDWLGFWFAQHFSADGGPAQGENELLRWFMHSDAKLIASESDLVPARPSQSSESSVVIISLGELQQRLSWEYPFAGATCHPAKTSVSALRRRAVAAQMEEAASLFPTQSPKFKVRGSKFSPPGQRVAAPGSKVSAVDVGNAHHSYLQLVRLRAITSLAGLKSEAARLEQEGALSAEEIALLDFKALASFGHSDLGRKICSRAPSARRELEFTARFAASELARLAGLAAPTELAEEFVVVQGVADLVVILPRELWLVDFKTDEITPGDISAKSSLYAPQLQIYALALSRIYRLPVTECWLYFLTGQKAVAVKTGL